MRCNTKNQQTFKHSSQTIFFSSFSWSAITELHTKKEALHSLQFTIDIPPRALYVLHDCSHSLQQSRGNTFFRRSQTKLSASFFCYRWGEQSVSSPSFSYEYIHWKGGISDATLFLIFYEYFLCLYLLNKKIIVERIQPKNSNHNDMLARKRAIWDLS